MPSSVLAKRFEADILNQTRTITSSSSSPSRNTYFLDGGHRFISLPTLGTHTKTAAHISRVFEEWLQNKLYHQHMADDRLPILEDSVDLLAEDIMNKLKSRQSVRGLIGGVAKIMIKIRTGHMYCFHQQTDNGLPSIEANVMDFIQQFPLFLDTVIYVVPTYTEHVQDDCIPILITIENVSTNPSDPYYLFENVSLLG
ncbi:uncharacterized protein BX664DRAFT_253974 [Halteromyces radiatus]|uniref:uncharacterized protein n=1 Tax=Halteromyces radiatus TaxID=101107 RepID=UPI002220AE63|nr:uncharacterized protein BX664DRAFT_253974 [Halteromyces radiatus]KAI8099430.1 hypothetical protein BX664DRAFT_253974 [Halteromyces radiatus]